MTKRKPQTNADDLLTSPAAAEIAGLDRVHFARLVREGKGPAHERASTGKGKRHMVLIRRGDLDAWLNSSNTPSGDLETPDLDGLHPRTLHL